MVAKLQVIQGRRQRQDGERFFRAGFLGRVQESSPGIGRQQKRFPEMELILDGLQLREEAGRIEQQVNDKGGILRRYALKKKLPLPYSWMAHHMP